MYTTTPIEETPAAGNTPTVMQYTESIFHLISEAGHCPDVKEVSCTERTAIIAGGIGGVMGLIILIQSVMIIILRQNTKNRAKRFGRGLNETRCIYTSLYTDPPLRVSTRWW